MLLVNHALARGIFVIFVVSRGSSSKALVLLVRMQIHHFRHFRQKPPFFWRDKSTVYQKHRFRDPENGTNGVKFAVLRRFSLTFADSRSFLGIIAFGRRRFSQKTSGNRSFSQGWMGHGIAAQRHFQILGQFLL